MAEGPRRRLSRPAQGRQGDRRRAGGGVDPPLAAARACRGGAGNVAGDRPGPRPRTGRRPPPRPGHRHDREPVDRAGLQAGDGARARSGDRRLQPRRDAELKGGRRRRALRRPGLAHRTTADDREGLGQEASRRRRAGPLRRPLELPRGALLPPGQARLQPRRQEGQAADRLWPPVRRRRLPGGGRSVRRRHRRSQDALRPDRQGQGTLRLDARGARRRPRHDHPGPPRPRDQAGRARLDHRPAGAGDPGAARRRRLPARPVRRARHGLDHRAGLSGRTANGLPQSGTGAPAGHEARGPAESHRTRPRPDRRGGPPRPKSAARQDRNRAEGRRRAQQAQDGQALRDDHRGRSLRVPPQGKGHRRGGRSGRHLCRAHQPAGGRPRRRRSRRRLQRASAGSSGPSAPSRPWTWRSVPSSTGPRQE